jgi:hypothetical protein
LIRLWFLKNFSSFCGSRLEKSTLPPKENEAKERAPSTWPSASLAKGLPAAVPQTRPDKSGLRQCGPFIRMQSLRSAVLNGIK